MRVKKLLKRFLPHKVFSFMRELLYPEKINILEDRLSALFLTHYQSVASPDLGQKVAFKNAEFKVYSKYGTDGILAYIFSKVGTTNHTFVEIGVENGRECNTANLSLNFGWNGLLMDAEEEWIRSARDYYDSRLGTQGSLVKTTTCFITADNINQLLLDDGFQGEIDLLSIDIDSNDYFVWKAINKVNPRVVVVEYNASFGLRPITIKYNPQFHYQKTYKQNPLYYGASLTAMTKLAKDKGYILVGCESHGLDAFFVRSDVAGGKFSELSPEEAFYPNPLNINTFGSVDEQFERIKHLDFEKIS